MYLHIKGILVKPVSFGTSFSEKNEAELLLW